MKVDVFPWDSDSTSPLPGKFQSCGDIPYQVLGGVFLSGVRVSFRWPTAQAHRFQSATICLRGASNGLAGIPLSVGPVRDLHLKVNALRTNWAFKRLFEQLGRGSELPERVRESITDSMSVNIDYLMLFNPRKTILASFTPALSYINASPFQQGIWTSGIGIES